MGAYRFQVLHIPGHTPGHVVFYCAEQNLLIAGDVLFYESINRNYIAAVLPKGTIKTL